MELNYLKLYFTLTLTGLTIWGVDELSFLYKMKIASDAMEESMAKVAFEKKSTAIRLQTDALRIKNEANEKLRIKNQKQQSINNARRTNNETCRFWSKEYSDSRTERNKLMMDGACERARKD